MDFIDICVAADASELAGDIDELRAFANQLTAKYASKGAIFSITQAGDDPPESFRHLYVLIGHDAETQVQQAFSASWSAFVRTGSPSIHTYFHELSANEEPAASVRGFMSRLDTELGHYWSTYRSVDTIKLDILMEYAQETNPDALQFRDGQARLLGEDVLSLGNVGLYANNQTLAQWRQELSLLSERLASAVRLAAQDVQYRDEATRLEAQRHELQQRLHQLESDILGLGMRLVELKRDPVSTWRTREASRLLESGDYEGAKAILFDAGRADEADQAERIAELGRQRLESWIREQCLLARSYTSGDPTPSDLEQARKAYTQAYDAAMRQGVGQDMAEEFARFLRDKIHDDEAASQVLARYQQELRRTGKEGTSL